MLLAAQGGVCGCCGSASPGHMRGWMLDHNHTTLKVRGLLCYPCNVRIGHLGDTLKEARRRFARVESYLLRADGDE